MTIIAALILLIVVVTYSVLTLLPLQYFDCPYRTPLSGGVWRLFRSYKWIWAQSTSKLTLSDETMVETMAHRAMEDSAEHTIRDGRALVWTVKSLSDDSELEPFVEGIPDVLWGLSVPNYPGPAGWGSGAPQYGYPVPVFLGSGGPRYGQRYSYADHIRELVNNPDVRLCDRIESHLQSCDTGLLSADVRKRRLIASYKALWAIATLFHPKQFPTQPLLDFSRWKRFFKMEEDSDILHYSVSAQALLRWNSVSAVEPRSLELLDYLAKCRIDIEQGREPDKQPLILILKEVLLEDNYYVQRVNHSNLTVELILEIETEINEIRCNTRFNYLERAAGLDSEPYQWQETLDLVLLPSFKVSKHEQPLGYTLSRIVRDEIQNLNTKNCVWIDTIILDLYCSYTPDSPIAIPAGMIQYLNERTGIDHSFWFHCTGRLLSNFPTTLSMPSSDRLFVTEDQLLTALWRLISSPYPLRCESAMYLSVLKALANSGVSAISISVTVLVKAKLYRSLESALTDENLLYSFNHPLLPTKTAVAPQPSSVVVGQDTNIPSAQMLMWNRIDEGMVALLAEFTALCGSDPFPYKAVETLQHIGHNLWPTLVHEDHQIQFAQAIGKLFESPHGAEVLPSVVGLEIFTPYVEEWEYIMPWREVPLKPWLTSSHARSTIKATFSAFAETLSNDTSSDSEFASRLLRLRQIVERLESLHPAIEPVPSSPGSFALYFPQSNVDTGPDIEENENEDPSGSLEVTEA
ncbi:hypothetical protein MVEN_01863600 [Mycena venus]|uniref:Uncharacterized protein n=1 Tax=Mycena venus TaxID=2733690 RepID=A0A8H7CKT7_9AGAR|nr:hypothetical protein MVEN_01863600 [Mycena venus]